MFCRMVLVPRKKKAGATPVYLNVYDLTPINGYAYWVGLGIYHSGVQVNGVEYGFGAHEYATTGVFEVEPKQCPGFRFRKSILIGRTDLGPQDVRSFMDKLAEEYSGNTYHLITRNCNHFCNDVCLKLTGKPIPRWVNRLARLGFLCNCVLPAGLNETKVHQVRSEDRFQERDKKLRRHHGSFPSTSALPSSLEIFPTDHEIQNTRQRQCLPQRSSFLHSSSTSSCP
ncbi:hypothetical protein SLA2020_484810 [Shorea laevis]